MVLSFSLGKEGTALVLGVVLVVLVLSGNEEEDIESREEGAVEVIVLGEDIDRGVDDRLFTPTIRHALGVELVLFPLTLRLLALLLLILFALLESLLLLLLLMVGGVVADLREVCCCWICLIKST